MNTVAPMSSIQFNGIGLQSSSSSEQGCIRTQQIDCDRLTWHVEISAPNELDPSAYLNNATRQMDATDGNVSAVNSGESLPVCLLLHGTGASSHSWASLLPHLSTQFTVISIDLPGHARTRTPGDADLSLPGMADAVHALVAQQHWHPALIIGHSAGAAIMVEMCLRNTARHADSRYENTRLVSINGALLPLAGLAGWVFTPLAKLSATASWLPRLFAYRANDPRQVKRLLDSTGSVIPSESLRCYEQLFRDPQHVAAVLRMMANWQLEKLQPRLSDLQQSIRLIAATGDRTIPLRDAYRLKTLFDHSSLAIVEGKGHLVHEEDPQRIAKLILEPALS